MGISWLSDMSLSKLRDIVKDGRDCVNHSLQLIVENS